MHGEQSTSNFLGPTRSRGRGMSVAKLEFAIWDGFGAYEMATLPVAADVYEKHIREAQLAEQLGYQSYYIIEHQNSHVGQITAPSVYLCAVAQHTSRLRIGVMIYQLPFYNPMRLAEEAARHWHRCRGARVHALELAVL